MRDILHALMLVVLWSRHRNMRIWYFLYARGKIVVIDSLLADLFMNVSCLLFRLLDE